MDEAELNMRTKIVRRGLRDRGKVKCFIVLSKGRGGVDVWSDVIGWMETGKKEMTK